MTPICPECGVQQPATPPRFSRASRRARVTVYLLATLVALIGVALTHVSYQFSSGTFSVKFVDGAVTHQTVGQAATGGSGSALTSAVLRASLDPSVTGPGDSKLYVAFGSAPNTRRHARTIGFPVPWLIHDRATCYENALTRSTPVPVFTDPSRHPLGQHEAAVNLPGAQPRPRWNYWPGAGGTVVYHPPPEETGGVLFSTSLRLSALSTQIAFVVLLALLLALAWRRLRRATPARRRVGMSIAAALLITAALVAMTTRSRENIDPPRWPQLRQVGLPPQSIYWYYDPFVEIPIRYNELVAMQGAPDADARLARAILSAVPPDQQNGHLAVWTVPEFYVEPSSSGSRMWATSIGDLHRWDYTRHPLHGSPEHVAPPTPWTLSLVNANLRVTYPSGNDHMHLYVQLPALLTLTFYTLLGAWTALAVWRLLISRRARRRIARRECVMCRYSLAS